LKEEEEGEKEKRPKGKKEDKERNGRQVLLNGATLKASYPNWSSWATVQIQREFG
jgi:hypothetical protein